jgi:hypothetical protein
MKFDPLSKNIYAVTGEFLKKMNCPDAISWVGLT